MAKTKRYDYINSRGYRGIQLSKKPYDRDRAQPTREKLGKLMREIYADPSLSRAEYAERVGFTSANNMAVLLGTHGFPSLKVLCKARIVAIVEELDRRG